MTTIHNIIYRLALTSNHTKKRQVQKHSLLPLTMTRRAQLPTVSHPHPMPKNALVQDACPPAALHTHRCPTGSWRPGTLCRSSMPAVASHACAPTVSSGATQSLSKTAYSAGQSDRSQQEQPQCGGTQTGLSTVGGCSE